MLDVGVHHALYIITVYTRSTPDNYLNECQGVSVPPR